MTPPDPENHDREDPWETVGRSLLTRELGNRRAELEDAFYDAAEALRTGEEITREDVLALRVALNKARTRVEEDLAPVAGVEPWGEPVPQVPMGVMWELTQHPKAEGVDPREYVEAKETDDG